jgi:D-3-phosphoglycerate dehydrogenase
MIRIGSALFNADHTRLGEEVRRVEAAGVDFLHFDVFDGYAVPDQAFPARTIKSLRPLTRLPFEVHLSANEPLRFLPALADAGADLVFLPAETTPLLYEAVFAVRELGMRPGLCLALGTPLQVLEPVLPMLDSVLLLGRVTGEGRRGRDFNDLVIGRVVAVRRMIDDAGLDVDLQAAGGLETESCVEAAWAGARSLPLGGALHREADMAAFVRHLRSRLDVGLAHENGMAAIQYSTAKPTTHHAPRTADQVAEDTADLARVAPESPTLERGRGLPITRRPDDPTTQQTWNVLVASRSFGRNCPEVLEEMKSAGCVFMPQTFDAAPTEAELVEAIREADVLISGTEPVTARVLAAAPRLKVISKHGVGYENIDLDAARERGIPVCIAAGAITDSVADMAMALLLALARKVPQGDRSTRAGEWKRMVGPELRGKTLGIVGLGQIGKAVCRRAAAFGMRVAAHDAHEDASFAASWGVEYLDLNALLERSDFVSLHAPVTEETRGLLNAERLAWMKPGAYLINTARGELVDEGALYDALSSGRLGGAASDVFVQEPPAGSPLLTLDNFIAAPHSAGQTPEGLRKLGEICAENVLRVLRGEEPLHRVA